MYQERVVLKKGDRVDRYTLVAPLGQGGQGSVWRAIDPLDGGVVRAIKLVEIAGYDEGVINRVWREGQILERAQHPALVRCHGLFRDPAAGVVGLVFDYVRGMTLGEATRSMSRPHAFAALEQIARALSHTHALGLVHRDLKLDNVLVTDTFWEAPGRDGSVKLVDFGIASPIGNPRPLTVAGRVIGTIPYLAPELVDPATWGRAPESYARDLFAFGVLAWELVFGCHPTGLRSDATAVDYARAYKAAQLGRIPWPPKGPDGAWGVAIGACLSLRAEDRPSSGAELLQIIRTGVDAKAANKRASAAAIANVTAPHRGPSSPSLGDAPRSTEPMPVSMAPTMAMAPSTTAMMPSAMSVREPPSAAEIPKSGWSGKWILLALLLGAGGATAGFMLLPSLQSKPKASHSVTPTPTSTPTPTLKQAPATPPSIPIAPTPPVTTTQIPPEDAAPIVIPCCGGWKDMCPSGQACSGGECTKGLPPDAQWHLRLIGVAERPPQNSGFIDMTENYPEAEFKVCISGGGPCKRGLLSGIGTTGIPLFDVHTSDLVLRGIDIEILEAGRKIVSHPALRSHGLNASVLCRGLLLYDTGSKSSASFYVSFFLDP